MTFMDDYNRGMDSLFMASPTFATVALSLGIPVANEDSPHRAFVSYDTVDKKINFNLKPSYIETLSDDEIGAVIAHEVYHVLLGHLLELGDEQYAYKQILATAHECIINDGLFANIGLELPEDVITGDQFDHDFSYESTKSGYDFLINLMNKDNQESEAGEKSENDKSDSNEDTSDKQGNSKNDETSENDSNDTNSNDGSEEDEAENGSGSSDDNEEGETDGDASGGTSDETDKEASEDSSGSDDETDDGDLENGENGTDEKNSNTDSEDGKDSGSSGSANEEGDGEANGMDTGASVCGGIQISDADINDMIKAIKDAFYQSKNDANVDNDELQDIIDTAAEELDIPTLAGTSEGAKVKLNHDSGLAMNWEDLLFRINPAVKDHGTARETYNWHRPPRRMGSFYPDVIMPSWKKKDVMDTSGDELPTFLIFVDVSGSIPRWIADKAVEMAISVPKDKIKARVFSFDFSVHEIDITKSSHSIIMGGGTNFSRVMDKVLEIEKENKKTPYVLVITDYGDTFSFNHNQEFRRIGNKWFWMEVPSTATSWPSKSTINSWRNQIQRATKQKDENFYMLTDFSNLVK